MPLDYVKRPCAECPWRTDIPPGQFTADRFRALATCADDLARTIFACHKSPEKGPFMCAGFLLQQGAHNLTVRMSRQMFADVTTDYPLHPNYRAMAIANGVPKNDFSLRNCRDDGQRLTGEKENG